MVPLASMEAVTTTSSSGGTATAAPTATAAAAARLHRSSSRESGSSSGVGGGCGRGRAACDSRHGSKGVINCRVACLQSLIFLRIFRTLPSLGQFFGGAVPERAHLPQSLSNIGVDLLPEGQISSQRFITVFTYFMFYVYVCFIIDEIIFHIPSQDS